MSYVAWLRARVGHRKVFLPFVTVILRDGNGRVLLQRRADFDFWGLPGGVLEQDEDVERGARRELAEETGLQAGPLHLTGIYTDPRYDVLYPNGDAVQQFTFCLEGQADGGIGQADGVETTAQEFVEPDALPDYNLPLWYHDMLAEALAGGPPAFRAPYALPQTTDQIAAVRPSLGNDLYTGVGATAVVLDGQGRLLMLQHRGEESWRLPSGFSDLGENAAQTAVRELWEETRLRIGIDKVLGVHASPDLNVRYTNGDQVRVVGVVFAARLLGGALQLDPAEIADAAWFRPDDVLAKIEERRRPLYERILRALHGPAFVY